MITQKNKQQGKDGEQIALQLICKISNPQTIMQVDWMFRTFSGQWVLVEVKHKSKKFTGKTIIGHGLDLRQVHARTLFYEETGIRCMLFIIEKENKMIYYQWLDKLEEGKFTTLPSKIRVYDINSFEIIEDYEKFL